MADRLAHGEILVSLNDRQAREELHRVERDYKRTMREIDRMKAEAEISASTQGFDKQIKLVKAEIKDLEGKRATAILDADKKNLSKEIAEAKAELAALDGDKATLEVALDKHGLDEAFDAQRRLEKLEEARHRATQKFESDTLAMLKRREAEERTLAKMQDDATRMGIKREQDKYDAMWKSYRLQNQAIREDLSRSKAREDALRTEARMQSDAIRLDQQRTALKEKAQRDEAVMMDRAYAMDRKRDEQAEASIRKMAKLQDAAERMNAERPLKVLDLQHQYARLTDRREAIGKRTAVGWEAQAKVKLDAAHVEAQMELLKAKLNALGAEPPVDIKVDLDRRGIGRVTGLVGDLSSKVLAGAANISDMTVRLGPFTTSIAGAIKGLAFMAPLLVDVTGAAGAFVGVLGTGITGAAALGTGALGAFGVALSGVGMLLPSLMRDFKNLGTLQDAYHKAVLKYGADSDKAKDKLEQYNNALGEVYPTTRKTFLAFDQLQDRWRDLSKQARPDFFNDIAAAMQVVEKHFDTFGKIALASFGEASHGWQDWMKGLKSDEASRILADLGVRGAAAIDPLMHAIGQIATMLARVAQSASRYLNPMMQGFDKWATGINNAAGNTSKLDSVIDRLVSHAKSVGSLFYDATRFLVHFFGAGADAGQDLVDTMDDAINRWDRWTQSIDGQADLKRFFSESVDGAQSLYASLKPILELFGLWAIGLQPAVDQIVKLFTYGTEAVNALGKIVGLQSPIATVGATLGTMWAVGRIGAFATKLSSIVLGFKAIASAEGGIGKGLTALLGGKARFGSMGSGIAAAGTTAAAEMRAGVAMGGTAAAAEIRAAMISGGGAAGIENAASGLLGPTGRPLARSAARTAAVDVAEVGAAAGGARVAQGAFFGLRSAAALAVPAIAELGVVTGTLASGGLALVAAGALYGAYKLLTMKSAAEKLSDALDDNAKVIDASEGVMQNRLSAVEQLGQNYFNQKQAIRDVSAAEKQYADAVKKSGKNSIEARLALQQLNQAYADRDTATANIGKLIDARNKLESKAGIIGQAHGEAVNQRKDAQEAYNRELERYNKVKQTGTNEYGTPTSLIAQENKLAEARQNLIKANNNLTASNDKLMRNRRLLAYQAVEQARLERGLSQLTGQAASKLADLAQIGPQSKAVATRIATKYTDPLDVQKTSRVATNAIQSGVKPTMVMRIIADSKNAEEAIKRLRQLRVDPKDVRVIMRGGKEAVDMLQRILGVKLTKKQQETVEKGGKGVLKVLADIGAVHLRDKILSVRANDQATSKLRGIQHELSLLGDKNINITTYRTEVSRRRAAAAAAAVPNSSLPKRNGGAGRRGGSPNLGVGPGFPGYANGGHVTKPMFMVGEEAPSHPEWVIATNPAYKSANIRYWMQAGHDLGIPGFAQGGRADFAKAILSGLGIPATDAAVKSLMGWMGGEGTAAKNNPLATTYSKIKGATNFNSAGVKNYPTQDAGVKAMVKTLQMSAYAEIRAALRRGASPSEFTSTVNASPWGTKNDFSGLIRSAKPGSGTESSIYGGSKSVGWAQDMIGHFEESMGNNQGPELNKLERRFGMSAQAWCAMFVSRALQKGGLPISTASVNQLVQWAKSGSNGFKKGVRATGKGTQKGDVWVDSSQTGHTGLVERVDYKKGIVYTVEGNTSAGKVARRQHSFGDGYTLRPDYGRVKGSSGDGAKDEPLVPGIKGYTLEEQIARNENAIGMMDAAGDDNAKYTNTYIGLQITKFQKQQKQIQAIRKRIKELNAEIAQPHTESDQQSLLSERSGLISTLGSLKQSQLGLVSDVNTTLKTRIADGVGAMERNSEEQLYHDAFTPNDLQGNLTIANERVAALTKIWDSVKNDPSIKKEVKQGVLQELASANQSQTQAQSAVDNIPSTLAQLYMQDQTTRFVNPLNNAMMSAQINTPNDVSDDLAAANNAVNYWTTEWQSAIASGVQERIDWAGQYLQQAQQQAQSLTDALSAQNRSPLETGLAVAGLTVSLQDDFDATQQLVGWWSNEYQDAVASGVQSRIATAAQTLAQYKAQAQDLLKKLQSQPLEAQYALAQLTDTMDDDNAALESLLSLHEAWLAQAQAIGDYAGIIEEAGQVKQLRDQLKQITDSQAQMVGEFNANRLNLYRTMGSNMAIPGAGQKIINVNVPMQYVQDTADPHTWANALSFELQAAV